MKNIVIADEYRSGELKPAALLKEYIALASSESDQFFPGRELKACACPACGTPAGAVSKPIPGAALNASSTVQVPTRYWQRFGLTYHECSSCLSLYVSPRPSDEAIVRFYKNSKARAFWNDRLYSSTSPRRQEKIIKPRFEWMEDSTQEYLPAAKHYADINANQRGYLAQVATMSMFQTKTLVDPLIPLQPSDIPAGVGVRPGIDGTYDVISLFEVLDHTSDVAGLFAKISKVLIKGGLCFITGILASGFDVKVLGEHAENIYPPDRLNVFSVEGLKRLAETQGFECLEFSTPGILDVDFVARAMREDPTVPLSPFERALVQNTTDDVRRRFQDFLQANLLSSYGRIVMRKK